MFFYILILSKLYYIEAAFLQIEKKFEKNYFNSDGTIYS